MRMWIELDNNRVDYKVGDWMCGRVMCNFKEPFETKILTLEFMGFESTWLQRDQFETDLKF